MLKPFFKKRRALFWQYILTSSGEPLAEVRFSVRFCESQELSALAVQMSRSHLNPNPTMTIAQHFYEVSVKKNTESFD